MASVVIQVSDEGLGMSIVKEIMDSHHGHAVIESHRGRGTRGSLALPQVQPK